MKLTQLAVAAVALGVAVGAAAQTATAERKAAARQKWESMTPEQKTEAKQKIKVRWESMTPEEQAAAKKRFGERHPRAAAKLAEKHKEAASAAK